jgi:two-component system chemotaxis response regulator CheB
MKDIKYGAVVIGASAGGVEALCTLLPVLHLSLPMSIIVVQHMSTRSDHYLTQYLDRICQLSVKEADEKEIISPGFIYLAPPNYHLLIEMDRTFSFTVDERVSFSRPSIDVLFETAAEAYGKSLIGIILTGANSDGSRGIHKIKQYGGLTVVQDPLNAEIDKMPKAAIQSTEVDYILSLDKIGEFLNQFI